MKRIMTMVIGTLIIPALLGAEADPEYIKSFGFDIKMQTLEDVRLKVSQESILKKYKLRLPILPPRLDKDQVTALVEKEIAARVEAAYPKSHFKEIEVKARERYRPYKLGDVVTMRVLDTRTNQFIEAKGAIRKIDKRGVLVGDTPHIFQDLDPNELTHFFQKKRDDAIMRYISGQTKVYEYQRSQEDKKLRKKLLPKIWMDEGYIWNRRKQVWTPREDVFNFLYEKRLIEAFDKKKPEVSVEVLSNKGGLKFDDALNAWIVPGEENPVDDVTAKINKATKTAADKTDDSLKNWANKFDDIFSEKDEDVWDDGEDGKDDKKKEEKKKKGDEATPDKSE